MAIVIKEQPIPIYETTCYECGSVFRYKAVEVSWMHITCPVCGVSNWASSMIMRMEKGKKMKVFNLVVEILWLITSVSFLIQDVRRWKNDKKEREFNKWLEERRKKVEGDWRKDETD